VDKNMTTDSNINMRQHIQLLGHSHYGVTELRVFEPRPLVAYAENESDIVILAMQLYRKVPGFYIGIHTKKTITCGDISGSIRVKAEEQWKI
jgi:hypothetical protein